MRLPRFTTLQLFSIVTLAALLVGVFLAAWRLRPLGYIETIENVPTGGNTVRVRLSTGEVQLWRVGENPPRILHRSSGIAPPALFVVGLAVWAAAWGVVRKRGRESLAKKDPDKWTSDARQRLPSPSAPLAMKLCWGLMIAGGLVALGIPIVLMFSIGPLLFPTIYFSLFVGLAAIARGAARDTVNLQRTAALQLANMIALDPANVIFAAMEFALLRGRSVRDYLNNR